MDGIDIARILQKLYIFKQFFLIFLINFFQLYLLWTKILAPTHCLNLFSFRQVDQHAPGHEQLFMNHIFVSCYIYNAHTHHIRFLFWSESFPMQWKNRRIGVHHKSKHAARVLQGGRDPYIAMCLNIASFC
jgi:hypothetical protein